VAVANRYDCGSGRIGSEVLGEKLVDSLRRWAIKRCRFPGLSCDKSGETDEAQHD
jgi:hypothetical protein